MVWFGLLVVSLALYLNIKLQLNLLQFKQHLFMIVLWVLASLNAHFITFSNENEKCCYLFLSAHFWIVLVSVLQILETDKLFKLWRIGCFILKIAHVGLLLFVYRDMQTNKLWVKVFFFFNEIYIFMLHLIQWSNILYSSMIKDFRRIHCELLLEIFSDE